MESNIIPAGHYQGKIEDYSISRKNDNVAPELQVAWIFEVPGMGQRRLTEYRYFTPNATPYTLKYLTRLGLRGDDPGVLVDHHGGSKYLDEASEFTVEIIHESYQGKTYAKVKGGYIQGSINKSEGMEANSLKSMLGGLKGNMMQARKETGKADPGAPQMGQSHPMDQSLQDIPF